MKTSNDGEVGAPMERQRSSRACFVCGRENEASLKATWYNDTEAQKVRATLTVPERFNGYPGIVHGGVVAALLDETAGRALLLDGNDGPLMVTLKLDVKYRLPTPTSQPVTLIGWVIHRSESRARVAAELRLADGSVAAQAEAVVVRPGEEFSKRWEAEKPFWRVYDD
jgi:uncharacterized protein (TIGR00369 family)